MLVNNISLFNKYNYQNNIKQNNTKTYQASVISFSSVKSDKEIAEKYYADFVKIIMLQEQVYQLTNEFFDDLMESLCKEPKSVLNKFFEIDKKNKDGALFNLSVLYDNKHSASAIVDLYASYADDKTKFNFIAPKDTSKDSPFVEALTLKDPSLSLPKSMFAIINSLSDDLQFKFWFEKFAPLDGAYGLVDCLSHYPYGYELNKSMMLIASSFKDEHPELLEKYNNKLKKKNLRNQPRQNLDNDQNNVAEDVKNSKNLNFRVYDKVKTTFKDVGGMFNVKKQIKNELLNIINNPKVKNSDKPSGIILYGPPGTGKTLLATAIAGEAKLPLVSTNGSSFNEIYVGSGAKRVRELFSTARTLARENKQKTAILFIDEADAVASKRTGENNSERNHTLNALLAEMDGVQSKQEDDIKVIVILATNRKDMFDEAFRKGRIDLEFEIDDPRFSAKARKEILEIIAKDKPFKSPQEKTKILKNLAQTSAGMSGAELADVIKKAYRKTLYIGRKEEYITEKDVAEAKLEALVGIKNDHEFSSDEIRHTMAHEAGHAINAIVMSRVFANEKVKTKLPTRSLDFIVNESRGGTAGVTVYKGSQNNHRMTVESLISSLVSTYGGYSIEEKLFDGHTDGVSADINQCANKVFNAVTKYGLGSKTKYIGCTPDGLTYELFKSDIKQDIIDYTNAAMSISMKIADFVRYFVEDYVERFINEKDASIITGEKFERLFNQWLVDTDSTKKFNAFCKEIRDDISNFKLKIQAQ